MAKKQKNKMLSTKRSISKAAKEIQSLFQEHIGKKITLKELKAMLAYLVDSYDFVSYKENVLTVRTEDIIGYEGNLGPYNIGFDLARTLKSLKKNDFHPFLNLESINGSYHEHIDSYSGSMCVGGGWYALRKCAEDGRLDDFIDIIQQILRT